MKRRTVIKGAAGTLSLGLMAPAIASPSVADGYSGQHNFVLVHGTWHGAWCGLRSPLCCEPRAIT